MNGKEALTISGIIVEAHCASCVSELCKDFEKEFPEHNWFRLVAGLNPEWWTEAFLRGTDEQA